MIQIIIDALLCTYSAAADARYSENLHIMAACLSLHSKSWAFIAVMLPLAATALHADDEQITEELLVLDPLVIVASKTERPLSEVAAQVTVVDAETIRTNLVEDLDGLFRYEPGLEIETSGTRFGATGVNVRGIGGNRVAIEQDGITVADRFVVGAFSDSGRAGTEIDRIKRVEVLYGPASVLYGSNALGGVIAITTWDPQDLLAAADGHYSMGLRSGYQSADRSWMVSAIGAAGKGDHGFLLAGTYRDGHQLENQAPAGTPEDPQNWHSQDFMLRYTFDTASGNRLRLTAMGQNVVVATEVNSLLGYGRRFRNTTSLSGDDQDQNQQYSLAYEFSWGGWDQVTAQLYHTDYSTEQITLETRTTSSPPIALRREFHYKQNHTGFDYSMFRQLNWGSSKHRFGLGLQWLQTDSSEYRDGQQTNLETGSSSNVVLGETMPVRDFPDSRSREIGLYVQDEISLGDGMWQIIPALRWDYYQLDPRPDELWLEDFPDMEVVSVNENEFTPRLGLLYSVGDHWSVYGQYARGFRAPPFEDANIGLDLPLFGYRAIPNPDLKSEKSNGFELGVRRMVEGSRFSLAGFDTEYDDFIESRALIGVDPASGDLLFQSRNIDKARIFGLDLRFDQDLGFWSPVLQDWSLNLAAYWAEGENRQTHVPLNSIAPPQAVLGLSWVAADGRWNLGITTTVTAAKRSDDIDEQAGQKFDTPSWAIFDLVAGWQATDWLEIRGAVFNLGNNTYWRWLDVARLDASDPMIPLLSRPGRNYSFTVRISF